MIRREGAARPYSMKNGLDQAAPPSIWTARHVEVVPGAETGDRAHEVDLALSLAQDLLGDLAASDEVHALEGPGRHAHVELVRAGLRRARSGQVSRPRPPSPWPVPQVARRRSRTRGRWSRRSGGPRGPASTLFPGGASLRMAAARPPLGRSQVGEPGVRRRARPRSPRSRGGSPWRGRRARSCRGRGCR